MSLRAITGCGFTALKGTLTGQLSGRAAGAMQRLPAGLMASSTFLPDVPEVIHAGANVLGAGLVRGFAAEAQAIPPGASDPWATFFCAASIIMLPYSWAECRWRLYLSQWYVGMYTFEISTI